MLGSQADYFPSCLSKRLFLASTSLLTLLCGLFRTFVFLSDQILTCFGAKWVVLTSPLKAFTHRHTLGAEVCFCMKAIPSLGEPKATFFLHCTRSHSSFSFFVWLSLKSIQISEKESGEVIGWQRGLLLGCGKGEQGAWKGKASPCLSACGF